MTCKTLFLVDENLCMIFKKNSQSFGSYIFSTATNSLSQIATMFRVNTSKIKCLDILLTWICLPCFKLSKPTEGKNAYLLWMNIRCKEQAN